MYRKAAEERIRKLRGLDRLGDIARRIVIAWEEAYAGAKQEPQRDVAMVHKGQNIELPEPIAPSKYSTPSGPMISSLLDFYSRRSLRRS